MRRRPHPGDAVGKLRQKISTSDEPANTLPVISALADPDFLIETEVIVPLP